MKYIKQRHINGCGIACVAMLTRVSYDKALKAVRPDRKLGDGAATSLIDILSGIENLGCRGFLSFKKSKVSVLQENALIVVKNPKGAVTKHHMIVWDADKRKILDPWGRESTYTIDEKYIKKYEQYRILLA